jgi:excisionase family DNA binding protein
MATDAISERSQKGTVMNTEHSHDDEHSPNPSQEEVTAKQPRHSLASVGGEPGMWTTWDDVPLVLKIVELAEVLRVSRATAYAAAKDGSIPSFRVRGALRCTRPVAWAVANGLNPWDYVGQNSHESAGRA